MTPELILFFTLATAAVLSALGMLLSPNAVHSALYLVANFAIVAVFFLVLGAPFIAMVQVTVYAGAIMVLFLFVIMLLGAELLRQRSTVLIWQPILAAGLGVIFLGGMLAYIFIGNDAGPSPATFFNDAVARNFGSPEAIGQVLFNRYLLPFEITSLLLLVAMIGAVILVREEKKKAA